MAGDLDRLFKANAANVYDVFNGKGQNWHRWCQRSWLAKVSGKRAAYY